MSNFKLLDNGFLTLKKIQASLPISSVFYEFYDDISVLETRLETRPNSVCRQLMKKQCRFRADATS
jgi:hypothetical protein